MSTDATTSDTKNNTTDDTLRHMVDDKNWAGIIQFLKKKDSTKTEALFVFHLLTLNRSSRFRRKAMIELLEDRDSEEAVELISMLITLGGQELVMRRFGFNIRHNGATLLHAVCRYNKSIDLVSKLINVGGEELVLAKDKHGETSLHLALNHNASDDVVLKLIEVGGEALALSKDEYGRTSLHVAVLYNASIDLISKLIEVGGEALVLAKNDNEWTGCTPLHFALRRNCSSITSFLIKKGIELQVEGEYSIGGLLSTSYSPETKENMFNKWDSVVLPALEQVMAEPNSRQLPILQALILHKAPKNIIEITAKGLPHSINTPDSFGRYPIDFTVRHGLTWAEGMKAILEGSNEDILERKDTSTGLYPFMVAALGDKKFAYDFDSVFHIIKSSPKLIQQLGANYEEEQDE